MAGAKDDEWKSLKSQKGPVRVKQEARTTVLGQQDIYKITLLWWLPSTPAVTIY